MQRSRLFLLILLIIGLGTAACSEQKPAAAVTAWTVPTEKPAATEYPSATLTPLLPSPSPSPTAVRPTLSPEPTIVSNSSLPAAYFIREISGHKQFFSLGCEAATAKDWANFFGYDFNEFEFQYALPYSDNPDLGFVGDVNAPWGQVPPYGYGVHAGPVAVLLNAYGIPAKAYKNYSLDRVTAKIAADKPVIAWVIGNVVGGVRHEYTDQQGNKVIVAAYEHVVIVTGYDEKNLRYMTNGKFFDVPKEVFLNSWGVLENMVIVDE